MKHDSEILEAIESFRKHFGRGPVDCDSDRAWLRNQLPDDFLDRLVEREFIQATEAVLNEWVVEGRAEPVGIGDDGQTTYRVLGEDR